MFGKKPKVSFTPLTEDERAERRELQEVTYALKAMESRFKLIEDERDALSQKLYSISTLKDLSSLSGILSSKQIQIEPEVVERLQRFISLVFDSLLPSED